MAGQGIRLVDHSSFVTYPLGDSLQEGEFSMMVLNADEGNPGDKSKIFSMQEGPDINDITTDDYRMTAELRGRNYGAPGSVTFRIIPGDGDPCDGHRQQKSFSSSTWYFWRFTWRSGVRASRSEAGRPERSDRVRHRDRLRQPPVSSGAALPAPRFACGPRRVPRRHDARHHHQERVGVLAPATRIPRRIAAQRHDRSRQKGKGPQPLSLLPFTFCLLCLRGRPRVTLS